MIKAIETRYAGCHFRSRLEARWAVFFDALGIAWEYEAQGFDLPSGRYLPDFYIPAWEKWIEVKASPGRISRREWTLMAEFGELARPEKFSIIFQPQRHSGRLGIGPTVVWAGLIGGVAWAADPITNDDKGQPVLGFASAVWVPWTDGPGLDAAIVAARSARFEHGQSGAS